MRTIATILCLAMLCSCAPAKFEPFVPPVITMEETAPYSIAAQLEELPKPEPLVRTYVVEAKDSAGNVTYVPTASSKATHILLTRDEYAKVGVLVKRAVAMKEIALEQENLINAYIDQLNHVKKLFLLEQEKANTYRQQWIDSENAFRQEKAQHTWDNRINRTSMYLITVGSIIVLALAL